MVNGVETEPDADWAGSRTAVAMALCGDAPSRTCGRAVGDTARAQRTQDNASKDRPQRRARDRAADAAGLVPPGALQVDRSAGDARAAHRTQAASGKTSRYRDELAWHSTWVRSQGRANHASALRRADSRTRCRASEPSDDRG